MKDNQKSIFKSVYKKIRSIIFGHRLYINRVSDKPDVFEKDCLYIIGDDQPWSVAMLCPCNCGEIIHISLIKDDSPRWDLHVDKFGFPSLHPSVWRIKGCKSHFILRYGKIIWCHDKHKRGAR